MKPTALLVLLSGVLTMVFLSGSQSIRSQSSARGYIGLGVKDATGRAGAEIGVVAPGSPADRAGLKAGDLVLAVNETPVQNANAMTDAIRGMSPGQTVHFTILRRGQQLTVAVVIGSPGGASQPDRSSGSASPVPAPSSSSGPAKPISVSGYTAFSDPLEQAFTIQVPSGWKTVGGLARRAALQINPFVRSLAPDAMTYLIIGEPTLPGYVPPNQMRNTLGYREGKMFDSGLGGVSMVLHYMPGAEFAHVYGLTALQSLCTNLRFSGTRERPDMAANADKLVPTAIPSISTGGEARFTCTHGRQEMEGRIEAVTRTTRDNVMWNVIFLKGFLAPRNQADKAEEILTRVGSSLTFNQAWMQKQSQIDQQAAAQINRNMQQYFRQERAVINNLNAVDENFSAMDDIVSGYSTYHDANTGNDYKLSNTNPYKWTDDSTGRIVSTPTNSPPIWGNYRSLPRVSQ